MADQNLKPLVDWIYHEILGIEQLLRKVAPNMHVVGGDVVTLAGPSAPVQREPEEPPTRRDWAGLPPIQRTAGSMPLVASPGAFAGSLPGMHAMPPIVQQLGHEVSSLATPGLVVARTRPVEVSTSGSMPAPVQRRAARGTRSATTTAPTSHAEPEPLPIAAEESHAEHPVDGVSHAGPDASSGTLRTASSPPVRWMPTISRMAVRVPDRPLTSAVMAARPAAVQRAAAASAAHLAEPGLPAPSGGMRRVPVAAEPSVPTVGRQASPNAAYTTLLSPLAAQAASGLTRSGIGAPVASMPASARPVSSPGPVVSRSTTSGAMPTAASGLRPSAQRMVAPTSSAVSPAPAGSTTSPSAANTAGASMAMLPHLPVARASGRPAISGGAQATDAPRSAPIQRSAAAPEVRPIAGANPIRPSIALQRSSADDDDDAGEDDSALPSPWWAPASESTGQAGFGGVQPAEVPARIQRSASASASPTFAATHRPPALTPATPSFVGHGRTAVQRSTGSAPRTAMPLRSPSADHSHAGTPSAPVAIAASGDERPFSVTSRSIAGDPVVQMTATSGGSSAHGSSPGQGSAAHPAVQRVQPTSETPVGPAQRDQSAPPSESELDELAGALFSRIRGRIRSELIHDREAKGLTFDHF